jgi:catechol 2,3-dioxygenase-like lactoylglutathione lyase family enzyme
VQIEALDHLVLTVRDLQVALAFYSRVLGMEAVTFGAGRRALVFGAQKMCEVLWHSKNRSHRK